MCLAAPARIAELMGDYAWVEVFGNRHRVNVALVPRARPGDYVLVHAGCALQVVDRDEAEETLRLLREILEAEAADKAG
ncbi:MAG: HypC/HybG/HupF family hydrogenase formation chaperone [Acetobacteraceae bacterium]|nr:HypC/HybG/HupF family hydrogenase formation chaperone [Acetobacteraceae bacterium]